MTRTITAMFDDYDRATDAVSRLKTLGIPESDISIVGRSATGSDTAGYSTSSTTDADDTGSGTAKGATTGAILGGGAGLLAGIGTLAIPGIGPVVAAGWLVSTLAGAVAGGAAGGIIGALTDAGMSEEEAHTYAEGIRRGGTIVTARVDDGLYDRARDILQANGTVNMDERTEAWRREGWQSPASGMATGSAAATGRMDTRSEPAPSGATDIPVVEEQLNVGKQRVETGRVRVESHPVERVVEQPIHLHDERVRVERTPVSGEHVRPGAIQDRVIEETEIREEPVVSKEARVVENVRVTKEGSDRTETVRDHVKRTEVEVEDTRDQDKSGASTTPKIPRRGA